MVKTPGEATSPEYEDEVMNFIQRHHRSKQGKQKTRNGGAVRSGALGKTMTRDGEEHLDGGHTYIVHGEISLCLTASIGIFLSFSIGQDCIGLHEHHDTVLRNMLSRIVRRSQRGVFPSGLAIWAWVRFSRRIGVHPMFVPNLSKQHCVSKFLSSSAAQVPKYISSLSRESLLSSSHHHPPVLCTVIPQGT